MKPILTDKQFHELETIVLLAMITLALIAGCQPFDDIPSPEMTSTTSPSPKPTIIESPAGAVYWRFAWQIATPEPARLPTGQLCAIVTAAEALHMRREPNEKAVVMDYLYNGEQVRVMDPNQRWWKVRTARPGANIEGWVNSKYLQPEKCK